MLDTAAEILRARGTNVAFVNATTKGERPPGCTALHLLCKFNLPDIGGDAVERLSAPTVTPPPSRATTTAARLARPARPHARRCVLLLTFCYYSHHLVFIHQSA